LALDSGSVLLGFLGGFVLATFIFTATGREVVSAAGRRAVTYIEPKR